MVSRRVSRRQAVSFSFQRPSPGAGPGGPVSSRVPGGRPPGPGVEPRARCRGSAPTERPGTRRQAACPAGSRTLAAAAARGRFPPGPWPGGPGRRLTRARNDSPAGPPPWRPALRHVAPDLRARSEMVQSCTISARGGHGSACAVERDGARMRRGAQPDSPSNHRPEADDAPHRRAARWFNAEPSVGARRTGPRARAEPKSSTSTAPSSLGFRGAAGRARGARQRTRLAWPPAPERRPSGPTWPASSAAAEPHAAPPAPR